ncbi:MAG TPA: four helix bundle protein [Gemmatimonadaceae bacterium]
MQDFRNLRVWRAAHLATISVHRATTAFPSHEQFGLVSQLRRAAASIGANIAEGCGRSTDGDMRRSLRIALGSACEVLNFLLLARDLGLLDEATFDALEGELSPVRRMLVRLIERLTPRKPPRPPFP